MRQRCSSFYIFVSQYEQFHDRLNKYLNKWEENRNRAIAKAISALAIKSGDDKSVDNKIDLHL